MRWPETSVVWKAIDDFLQVAYDGPPPSAVRSRLETLRGREPQEFYDSPVFEHKGEGPEAKLLLRLGNRFYPHMKMTIERRPDRHGCLFRADTHDAHCCPAHTSREYAAFRQLMELNQTVAQAIESAWERDGLPTFKTYLKEDLARRQEAAH
ncbi:MAG TPA: hypothetical protein VH475_26160 [Tepidisphaeraceae bacterium]|jgi:hypothetical protein